MTQITNHETADKTSLLESSNRTDFVWESTNSVPGSSTLSRGQSYKDIYTLRQIHIIRLHTWVQKGPHVKKRQIYKQNNVQGSTPYPAETFEV